MNCIEAAFGRKKVFLPVIHPTSRDRALRALADACENGADGVFLINQGLRTEQTLVLLDEFLSNADFWIGANVLGASVQALLASEFADVCPYGIWSDWADPLVDRRGWNGIYFGGVAFKYQAEVRPENEAREIRHARTSALVDVVTTSGPATGQPADLDKVRRMREILGDDPLAIASGITPDNVRQYTPHVDAFLVATGVEREFGVFDPEKLRRVADAIHEA